MAAAGNRRESAGRPAEPAGRLDEPVGRPAEDEWRPSRNIVPPPLWETWRWHFRHGVWRGRSYKEGPQEGGPDMVPGQHTEQNRRKKERREARAERIRAEDAADPGGAAGRAEARALEQLENDLKHAMRVASTQAVMETTVPDVVRTASRGPSFAARVAVAPEAVGRRGRSPNRTDRRAWGGSSGGCSGPWQSARADWQRGTWPKEEEEEEDRDEQAARAAWSSTEPWGSTRARGSWESWS